MVSFFSFVSIMLFMGNIERMSNSKKQYINMLNISKVANTAKSDLEVLSTA